MWATDDGCSKQNTGRQTFPIFSKFYLLRIYKNILTTKTLPGSAGSLWGKNTTINTSN